MIGAVTSMERAPSAGPTAYVLGGNAAGLAVVRALEQLQSSLAAVPA